MTIDVLPAILNESLSSWLIRNSIAQGSDPMGWTYGIWGDWRVWTKDIDRYLAEDKAIQLKRSTGMRIDVIQSMTLAPFLNNIYGELPDTQKAWKWVIPTGQRNRTRTNGMPFCPECLKDKLPHFPIHWRFSWNVGCNKHGTLLQVHCPKCNTVFSPQCLTYDKPHLHLCTSCGHDLSSIHAPKVDNDLMVFQLLLDTIAQDNISGHTYALHPSPTTPVIFFQLLRDLLSLPRMIQKTPSKYTDWIGNIMSGYPILEITKKSGITYDMLSVKERHYLLKIATILLRISPDTLLESFQKAHITYGMITDRNYPSSGHLKTLFLRLPRKTPHTRARAGGTLEIKPRSREEVDVRMDRIRRFL